MRSAAELLIPLLALAACSGSGETGNEAAVNRAAAPTEIDVLPADESVGTESGELAAGVNDPELDEAGSNAIANAP